MNTISNRAFGIILAVLLVFQAFAGMLYIDHPFTDGRYHYNWGPPFWLMHAQTINEIGLSGTHFGLKEYSSHPQLIGPVIASWTQMFGYSEAAIRTLALFLTLLATLLLSLAVRSFIGNRRALIFALFFASLPIIYIYGKKLDQEVLLLVFLGMHLWGIGLFEKSKRIALPLVAIGSLGMMLSDWSGAIFALATAFGVLVAWGWRDRKKDIITFVLFSFAGSAIGLFLFLFQSYLQSGLSSATEFIQGYVNLWKYRVGATTENFTFLSWPISQIKFILANFSVPVFLAGLFGLFWQIRKKVQDLDEQSWKFAVLVIAVLLGSLAYMLAVPQASAIHVYYQYYWGFPIAVGLVFLVDFIVSKFKSKNQLSALIFLVVTFFFITAGVTFYQYNKLLFVDSWGNKTDVELLRSLRDISPEASVITANDNPVALEWFYNPNITYYSGRQIRGYLFSDSIPLPDYFVLPRVFADDVTAFINGGEGYGVDVSAEKERCSDNLCLIKTQIMQ